MPILLCRRISPHWRSSICQVPVVSRVKFHSIWSSILKPPSIISNKKRWKSTELENKIRESASLVHWRLLAFPFMHLDFGEDRDRPIKRLRGRGQEAEKSLDGSSFHQRRQARQRTDTVCIEERDAGLGTTPTRPWRWGIATRTAAYPRHSGRYRFPN